MVITVVPSRKSPATWRCTAAAAPRSRRSSVAAAACTTPHTSLSGASKASALQSTSTRRDEEAWRGHSKACGGQSRNSSLVCRGSQAAGKGRHVGRCGQAGGCPSCAPTSAHVHPSVHPSPPKNAHHTTNPPRVQFLVRRRQHRRNRVGHGSHGGAARCQVPTVVAQRREGSAAAVGRGSRGSGRPDGGLRSKPSRPSSARPSVPPSSGWPRSRPSSSQRSVRPSGGQRSGLSLQRRHRRRRQLGGATGAVCRQLSQRLLLPRGEREAAPGFW